MRTPAWPRWLGLVALILAICAGAFLARFVGLDAALLRPLSERLPLAAAGTFVSPVLSAILGIGAGLLGARRSARVDQNARSLILTAGSVMVIWVAVTSAFWFVVQGELMPLLDAGPAGHAGLSAFGTLLLPGTAAVLGASAVIGLHVRSTTRRVVGLGYLQTNRSRGLSIAGPVVRLVLRRTAPAVLGVAAVELVILYAAALSAQAVFATPSLAERFPVLVPTDNLPVVLGVVLLCIIGPIAAGVGLVIRALAPTVASRPSFPFLPENQFTSNGERSRRAVDVLPSTSFRAADFLDIRDLRTRSVGSAARQEPLAGISLTVPRGQALAVICEDDAAAKLLCEAITGLLPPTSPALSGSILFDGTELVGLPEGQFKRLRGHRIGFVASPAANRLDPGIRVGNQLMALMARQAHANKNHFRSDAFHLLGAVGVENLLEVFESYPRQLSAANAQRVLLAGALAADPQLLVADDPTRGMSPADETDLLARLHVLQRERGFALILATSRIEPMVCCDRVAVMSQGVIVEYASVHEVLDSPRHPETRRLIIDRRPGAAEPGH